MTWDAIKVLRLIEQSRAELSRQQYKTLRGQVFAGEYEAAMRGLQRLKGENSDL